MTSNSTRAGLIYGVVGFIMWGLSPLYWHALVRSGPWEVLAYRILGTVVIAGAVLGARHKFAALGKALRTRSVQVDLLYSSLLIGGNWTCFVWAVMQERLLEASLGYYLCPLVSIALGVFLLKEPITRVKAAAVGLAALGVGALMIGLQIVPWIPVFLAVSFGLYGFVRKRVNVDAMEGLFVETAFWLVPSAAVLWLLPVTGTHTGGEWALLLLAGPFTLLPLLFYTQSARRLRLSTLGFLQYVAPTFQLLLAAFVFKEHVTTAHFIAFGAIWLGIVIFTWDSTRRAPPVGSLSLGRGPG